jgi:putative ABC transport system permease protein
MTIGWIEVVVSLTLVVVAMGLSLWKHLGAERSILWACLRAAVQLLAVGLIFRLIFDSSSAMAWAALWVLVMTAVSVETVRRRVSDIPHIRLSALVAIGGALVVSLGILFGFGVFDLEPVTVVVIAGITLGNTMPSAVLATDTAARTFSEHPERIEGLLALGMSPDAVSRFITPEAVRHALIPQIERTKVVGLIALPGAMTGMLLAGADAIDAVLVQLVIMYLILGAVAIAVVAVVTAVAMRAFTVDARLDNWVKQPG